MEMRRCRIVGSVHNWLQALENMDDVFIQFLTPFLAYLLAKSEDVVKAFPGYLDSTSGG